MGVDIMGGLLLLKSIQVIYWTHTNPEDSANNMILIIFLRDLDIQSLLSLNVPLCEGKQRSGALLDDLFVRALDN